MIDYAQLYIDGVWCDPSTDDAFEVVDPTTELPFASIPRAEVADMDAAIEAAGWAFPAWSATAPADRATHLVAIADGLEARQDEIADVVTHELGMPRAVAGPIQVGSAIASFRMAAELANTFAFESDEEHLSIVREPVGVVGAITPWNYPLHQVAAKVAYALAAGCTVVLKPSEVAPVSVFMLTEVIDGAELPAGTFNLVTGLGPVVGERLAEHPGVDMVSFTGSTAAGRRVAAVAAGTVKKVALELGGKSANVLLDDADFPTSVSAGVAACFLNSGQTCSALTRMIVPRARLAEVEQLATEAAESYTLGDPFERSTRLGPLVSAAQRDRVRSLIDRGVDEGAKLLTGGAEQPTGLDTGYFVRPTVFSEVKAEMTIAREEIFGPVLVILAYDDEEEAVSLANDSSYGLSGGVSGSPDRAHAVARRLRTGQVRINAARPVRGAPFGGYRQSGLGREHGRFGLEEFLEVKAVVD